MAINSFPIETTTIDLDSILGSISPVTAELTLNVPTDYPSFQEALDAAISYSANGQGVIGVNFESGQTYDPSEVSLSGDAFKVVVTSDDAVVSTPAGFPDDDYLIVTEGVSGLTWDILVDMGGSGRGGFKQSRGTDSVVFTAGSGVINAGGNGSDDAGEDDDPAGFNLFVLGKAYLLWDEDTLVGANFGGSVGRGIWATYGSTVAGKYVSAQNCGSDPAFTAAHAALFVSRGATAHLDSSNFSGSQMGVRVARGLASFRGSNLSNIPRHAVVAFEDGVATCSSIDVNGSGESGHAILCAGNPDNSRHQGSGRIGAENISADNTSGILAATYTKDSSVNLDNGSCVNSSGSISYCKSGFVSLQSYDFTASEANFETHLLSVSYGGVISAFDLKVRNYATDLFSFEDGSGSIELCRLTLDTHTEDQFSQPVTLGDSANFSSRLDFVVARDLGFFLTSGKTIEAEGLPYKFSSGATPIEDLPDIVPVSPSFPEHFGDSSGDDTDRILSWASYGGYMQGNPDSLYTCSTLVSSGRSLDFAANSVVIGKNITIEFSETSSGNTQRGTLNIGAILSGLKFLWSDNGGVGHFFERFLSCKGDNLLENVTFEAETDQPDANDDNGYDSCVRVDGDNVSMRGVKFKGIWDCARAWAGAAIDDGDGGTRGPIGFMAFDTEISRYSTGFTIGDFASDVLIDGLQVGVKASSSGTNPGENVITGGVTRTTVRNVVMQDSGEHGIYLSANDGAYGLTLENVRILGSGQCAVKLRNWTDFSIRDVHAANAHNSSAVSDNEDGLRIEDSINGRVVDYHHGNETDEGNGGNVGLVINSCSQIDFVDCSFRSVQGPAVIEISDSRTPDSVDKLRFFGLQVEGASVPIFDIEVNNLPDKAIVAREVFAPDATGNVVQINATGTVGTKPVYIQGHMETTGSLLNNIAGGAGVVIETHETLNVGGTDLRTLNEDENLFVDTAQFDPSSGQDATLVLRQSGGTEGLGQFGSSLMFTKINSSRPAAVLAARQGSNDADQMSLSVFTKRASSTSDTVEEHTEFEYNGGLNLKGAGGTPTLKVSGVTVVKAQQAALPADATDLASAISLVNALKDGLNENGHGMFSGT